MKFANYSMFSREIKSHGFEYAVEHTAKIGFDGVEFLAYYNGKPFFESIEKAREAKRILDSYGLSVCCYSMLAKLTVPDPAIGLDPVLYNIDCAAELGSPYFHHTVIPEYTHPTPDLTYAEALAAVSERASIIVERCAKYGMTCLYEPQGIYMNGVDGLSGILNEMKKNHSNVGICGDVGNSLWIGVPPEDIYAAFSKDIKHIHVKDYVIKDTFEEGHTDFTTSGKAIYEAIPGEGIVDFKKVFSYVKGYTGDIGMEFSCDDDTMRKSIEYIKSYFGK